MASFQVLFKVYSQFSSTLQNSPSFSSTFQVCVNPVYFLLVYDEGRQTLSKHSNSLRHMVEPPIFWQDSYVTSLHEMDLSLLSINVCLQKLK